MMIPDVPAGGAPVDAGAGMEAPATLRSPPEPGGPRTQLRQVKDQVVDQARG
jgi:hypothetical protein